jgi:hypothetical protein
MILLFYYCFISPLESSRGAPPDIVHLSCAFLVKPRNILPPIVTQTMCEILRELHIRLVAYLMVNSREEAIAAYS